MTIHSWSSSTKAAYSGRMLGCFSSFIVCTSAMMDGCMRGHTEFDFDDGTSEKRPAATRVLLATMHG